jgi:hypothetical protein
MAPRSFKPLDIEDVIAKLSLNEKTRLLAGIDNVSCDLSAKCRRITD